MTTALIELLEKYQLPVDALEELIKKEQEGWVFVASEENLNDPEKHASVEGIAQKYALGNSDAVLGGEVENVIKRDTSKKIALVIYLVEPFHYLSACHQQQNKSQFKS